MINSTLYHGTPSCSKAEGILEKGICPNLSATEGLAKPVDGCVYLTVNLRYAIIYLLGGDMLGSELPASWIKESSYGYLFIVPGQELSTFNPDEDQIGQAIHDRKFSWCEKYDDFLESQEPLPEEDSMCDMYSNLLQQVQTGEYSAWIKAGHLLLNKLTDEEKQDIISQYGNVANFGVVRPSSAWKFDKNKSSRLKEDGSNFFELAEKIL